MDLFLQANAHDAVPALADDVEASEESEADSPHAAQPGSSRRRAKSGLAALGQDQQTGEDDADDFRADLGSEEEDDEATLEEEEVGHMSSSACREEWACGMQDNLVPCAGLSGI